MYAFTPELNWVLWIFLHDDDDDDDKDDDDDDDDDDDKLYHQ